MISKKLARYGFLGTLAFVLIAPTLAFAEEAAGEAAAAMTMGSGVGVAGKAIAAALAIGMAALGAGWAQARIGSAGQGTLAERPEERIFVLVLTALPEIIVLLGFVMAILING